jgi:hypothetical protein
LRAAQRRADNGAAEAKNMTVGELRLLLRDYDDDTHIGVVWSRPQVAHEGPWLAEVEKLITATANDTGEVDLFLEAIEFIDDLTSESQ